MSENGPEDVVLSDEEIESAQGGGTNTWADTTPGEIGSAGEIGREHDELGREHGEGIIVE